MGSGFGPCENNKHVRAEEAEQTVWEVAVYLATSPTKLGELLDREIAALRERTRGNSPDRERVRLERRLDEIEAERVGYLRLNARGVLSDTELDRELDRLKAERGEVERRLEATTDLLGQIENLESLKAQMFLRYMYEGPELMEHWSPEQRQQLYHDLGLMVYLGEDGVQDVKWSFSGTVTTSPLGGTRSTSTY